MTSEDLGGLNIGVPGLGSLGVNWKKKGDLGLKGDIGRAGTAVRNGVAGAWNYLTSEELALIAAKRRSDLGLKSDIESGA
jgi:hypothetical protein